MRAILLTTALMTAAICVGCQSSTDEAAARQTGHPGYHGTSSETNVGSRSSHELYYGRSDQPTTPAEGGVAPGTTGNTTTGDRVPAAGATGPNTNGSSTPSGNGTSPENSGPIK